MHISVGYAHARLITATDTEKDALNRLLTVRVERRGKTTKRLSLLSKSLHFPAGLVRYAKNQLSQHGMDVHLTAAFEVPRIDFRALPQEWSPRAHQQAVLSMIEAKLAKLEPVRGIIQHATGTGKGDLIGACCRRFGVRSLIVVTSTRLMAELGERLKKFKVQCSLYGGGYKDHTGRVVVCVVNSLEQLSKGVLATFQAVYGDEVHGAAARGYYKALMLCKNAYIRLGFSGTPFDRGDRKTHYVVGAFGSLFHSYMPSQAAADKVVAKARVRMVPFFCKQTAGNSDSYQGWYTEALAQNALRNQHIARLVSNSKTPCWVFVGTHEHQKELKKLIPTALTVNNTNTADEIEATVKQLKTDPDAVLISTPIFRQGVDVAEVHTVIHASGGKSTIDVIQKLGRGSRRNLSDGTVKDEFTVYDIADKGCGKCSNQQTHHKGCEWSIKHTEERRQAYIEYGFFPLDYEG